MAYNVRIFEVLQYGRCLPNVPHMKAQTFPQRKWEGGT